MNPEFMLGERVVDPKLVCTECGGRAEGNSSWCDGSGDICDRCVKKDLEGTLMRNSQGYSYDSWYTRACAYCASLTGLSLDDFPDGNSRDAFDGDMTYEEYVREHLENEGYPLEDIG